ncbi:MAG: transglutaminase family protein [Actinomycetota bacterium]
MDGRLGWLAALAAIGLALARLGRLIEPIPEGGSWQVVVLLAIVVGGAVTASGQAARLGAGTMLIINAVGAGLAFCRVAASSTLVFGLIPSAASIPVLQREIGVALELIRFGSAPVTAATGLVAVLIVCFWAIGAWTVYALTRHRPLSGTIPSLAFYLLAATLDRRPPEWWWPAVMVGVGACALLAGTERKRGGRARSSVSGRIIPAAGRLLPVALIFSLSVTGSAVATRFAATVPESGAMAWRNPTGFGGGLFGGIAYNLFTSWQQNIVSESDETVFAARVSESAPPNDDLYWKLITLDTYDGDFWLPASLTIQRPQRPDEWEDDDFSFRGPSVRVESVVRIDAFQEVYLPHLYSPRRLETTDRLLLDSYRARADGSVRFDARTTPGLMYQIISEIPQPDWATLASSGGELSPVFSRAQDAGLFSLSPVGSPAPPVPERVRDIYTELPEDFSDPVRTLTRLVTNSASTPFERGLVLEEFFRSIGGFVYDATVSTGHTTLDLDRWLLDPASRNYRRGYCEQFAAAMAVMSRAAGIPARLVLGWAPGTIQTQLDGSEIVVVPARNYHAWVELYMAGQGWVRFDPTPRSDRVNQPTVGNFQFGPTQYLPEPIDPAQTGLPAAGANVPLDRDFLELGADPTLGTAGPEPGLPIWAEIGLMGLSVPVLISLLKLIRRQRRIARVRRGDVTAGWLELVDRLGDLGQRPPPSLTPIEISQGLGADLQPLARRVTASVFGRRQIPDGLAVFREAEHSLRRRFSTWKWVLSWLRPPQLRTKIPESADWWNPGLRNAGRNAGQPRSSGVPLRRPPGARR